MLETSVGFVRGGIGIERFGFGGRVRGVDDSVAAFDVVGSGFFENAGRECTISRGGIKGEGCVTS